MDAPDVMRLAERHGIQPARPLRFDGHGSYHTSFVTLGDIGVVDRDFAARIARTAGLR